MKQVKRAITLLLALLTVFSLTGVQVFAKVPTTSGYLAIGDSVSRGGGSVGYYDDGDMGSLKNPENVNHYDFFPLRNVEGSFPLQLANELGYGGPDDITKSNADYWPCCYPGMTTSFMLDLLGIEDNYTDTALDYQYYDDMLQYFGCEESMSYTRKDGTVVKYDAAHPENFGQCGDIIELIQRADLITLQLGLGDVFYRVYRIASNGGTLADGASFDISSPLAILNLGKTIISEMQSGYEHWEEYYPVLLQTIQKLNPDATIVMVGSFNLVNQVTISDSLNLPVGSAFSLITEKMNRTYEKWAKEYNVLYADISNVETKSTEEGWSLLGQFMDNAFIASHPTQTGYNYITRQILNTLEDPHYSRNIVVDLGRFNNVKSVSVNGIPVTNYKMQDKYTISIPNISTLANTLTVVSEGEDGDDMVIIYKLTYHAFSGYTAHRLYALNHYTPHTCKLLELLTSTINMLTKFVKI